MLSRSTVCCGDEIVAVGLNATRTSISCPFEMPPCTPPDRFVAVAGRPSGPGTNWSLCSRPVMSAAAKPDPISKPFDAGNDIVAFARSASSLSNTGSPQPAGTPRATQVTTPPSESPSRRARSIAATISSAASGSGQRVGDASTCSSWTCVGSIRPEMSWIRLTQPSTSTPTCVASSLRATAAAATRPIVSRAEARPPPATARIPYFASVDQSACDGRYRSVMLSYAPER